MQMSKMKRILASMFETIHLPNGDVRGLIPGA